MAGFDVETIVIQHHERPDGNGYPHRLRGDEIPLAARIVHVVDAFDAITSARAYRPARSTSEALRELWRHAGAQFYVEVVRALAATVHANVEETRIPSPGNAARLAVVHGRRATAGSA